MQNVRHIAQNAVETVQTDGHTTQNVSCTMCNVGQQAIIITLFFFIF